MSRSTPARAILVSILALSSLPVLARGNDAALLPPGGSPAVALAISDPAEAAKAPSGPKAGPALDPVGFVAAPPAALGNAS